VDQAFDQEMELLKRDFAAKKGEAELRVGLHQAYTRAARPRMTDDTQILANRVQLICLSNSLINPALASSRNRIGQRL
jgi:hypothetical protein